MLKRFLCIENKGFKLKKDVYRGTIGIFESREKERRMKDCEIKREGDALVAMVGCEIDHHTARVIREMIDGKLADQGIACLRLDFSAVTFMDSSGIGLIIGRAAKAEKNGTVVEVTGLKGSLRRLVRMSGIEKIPNVRIK